jgi:hypothetical protein
MDAYLAGILTAAAIYVIWQLSARLCEAVERRFDRKQ